VKRIDGILRLLLCGHGHKSIAAGFSREFVDHQRHFADSASLAEEILQVGFGDCEGEIAHVESIAHYDDVLKVLFLSAMRALR
jgi:hypothetical protein